MASGILFRAGFGRPAARALGPKWPRRSPSRPTQPALIVLDKDGTILEFESLWSNWLHGNINRVVSHLDGNTAASERGGNHASSSASGSSTTAPSATVDRSSPPTDPAKDSRPCAKTTALRLALAGCESGLVQAHSPMAHFSMSTLRQHARDALTSAGVPASHAAAAVEAGWVDEADHDRARTTAGAVRWCEEMKQLGATLAVCTSDTRGNAEAGLRAVGVRHLFGTTDASRGDGGFGDDLLCCGDDPDYEAKPSPSNVRLLQKRAGVPEAERVVMVGDSPLDVGMGLAMGAGLTVGVLSGVARREQLLEVAQKRRAETASAAPAPAPAPAKTMAAVVDHSMSVAASPSTAASKLVISERLSVTFARPDLAAPYADVLVIGGGSAGCTVAARLAEADPNCKVVLVEAGGPDRGRHDSWRIHMPAALTYNIGDPRHDWGYQTEPLPQLNGRRLTWPRGKVLGGSSSLNAMV
jgi:phosphoglycolate phosphatase-like HAD superfamily hydrolase